MPLPRHPIEILLDKVEWEAIARPKNTSGVYATHFGLLHAFDYTFRVYILSDGRRVLNDEDVARFFGWDNGEQKSS